MMLTVIWQLVLSQDPSDDESSTTKKGSDIDSLDGVKFVSETKVIPRT